MDMTTTLVDHTFRKDVRRCFERQTFAIPARWLYDRRGSELFEEITELPEYYPTLEHSASQLQDEFPDLPILPVEADFMKRVELPKAVADMPKLGFFPGSTIGNMIARTSVDLLRFMRETLGEGAQLLIGFDRIKDEQILVNAYDDSAGVTAQFSLNLLDRINRELDGNIPVDKFRHVAVWSDIYARIEIYLEAQEDVEFSIDGAAHALVEGQRLHIENSHKYGLRDARLMLRAGGWTPLHEWSDERDYFTLMLVEAHPYKHAP